MARNTVRKIDSYKQIDTAIAKAEKRLAALKESKAKIPTYSSSSKGKVFIKDMHDAHIVNALRLDDDIIPHMSVEFIDLIGELYSRGYTGYDIYNYVANNVKFTG